MLKVISLSIIQNSSQMALVSRGGDGPHELGLPPGKSIVSWAPR
jgi:hypothetical protein